MSDLTVRLARVENFNPELADLMDEAVAHINMLEATLKSYRAVSTKQQKIIKQYRRGVIDDINRLLEETRTPDL